MRRWQSKARIPNAAKPRGVSAPGMGAPSRSYEGNTYPQKSAPIFLSDGSLQYTLDAPAKNYASTLVDGTPLSVSDVTVTGNTVITISPAYLAKLPNGSHTLRIQFTDGRADTLFTTPYTAAVATTPVVDVPATGGGPQYSLYLLFCMACALASAGYVRGKRSR